MDILITLLLVIIVLIIWSHRGKIMSCYDDFMDEEETVTTTTTEQRPTNVVGPLKREVEGDQFFVVDPVDQKKIYVNSNDDLYEDAAGKIWKLV